MENNHNIWQASRSSNKNRIHSSMTENKHRLDRFLSIKTGRPKKHIRLLLAQKRVYVDNELATNINQTVDQFSRITLYGHSLQNKKRIYLMLHKPIGVVSATKDNQHKTVLDLIKHTNHLDLSESELDSLHIVGRLDLNSTGLLLLTNDGEWSKHLMSPENKVDKLYEVEVEHPITPACIQAFSEGMYFPFENITTKPATITKIDDCRARIRLSEGKYHQIKRMFGRFRNPVLKLHRTAIGGIKLDACLKEGSARALTDDELLLS